MERNSRCIFLAVMMGLILFCSGCKDRQTEGQERVLENLMEVSASVQKAETIQEVKGKEDLRNFFEDYFSFSIEELMILNQSRVLTDELYWKQLDEYYAPLIEEKIGKYLTDELREQIKYNYRTEEIELPKWILINGYIVSGGGQVHQINLQNTTAREDKIIYQVQVTTTHSIVSLERFNEQYKWEEVAGYYIPRDKAPGIQSYETGGLTDEIKLQQSFLITVDNSKDEFKICRINTNALWQVIGEEKQSLLNTQYVERMPYYEEVSEEEIGILKKLFTILFEKDIQAYKYYENAYDSGYRLFEKMWQEWQLGEIIRAEASSYQQDFPKNISPYKDRAKYLKADLDNMRVQTSVYSTLKQPYFIISLPVQALLYNNQIVYYNYKYFVGMKENKVEFMQFMSMKELKR